MIILLVPLTTTSIRHLQGEINTIQFSDLQLHWNSMLRQITIAPLPSNLLSIFQTILIFLFPPSLTMNATTCLRDDAFQRDIRISFADGSQMTMVEMSVEKKIQFHGSCLSDYQFENQTFFSETLIQINPGRFRTFSNGLLRGKQMLGFNYTQTIDCTPNKEYLNSRRAPIQYLKQLYTLPIHHEREDKLEWYVGSISEWQESWTCPNGFELKDSFCQECNDCQPSTCEIGYRKNSQSGLCEDIDECLENSNLCQYMCENQLGTYRCYCPMGFKMSNSGQCQDVNECDQFQIDCGQDRTCFNTRGAYECVDIPCPVGYIRQNDSSCLLKCHQRSSSTCSPRRAIHIRYKFLAIPRLTSSNETLFTLPIIPKKSSTSLKLLDRNHLDKSFPFFLNDLDLQTNRTLIESNEYEFEIHLSHEKHSLKPRLRLHTIFIIRIHVSPFHF